MAGRQHTLPRHLNPPPLVTGERAVWREACGGGMHVSLLSHTSGKVLEDSEDLIKLNDVHKFWGWLMHELVDSTYKIIL